MSEPKVCLSCGQKIRSDNQIGYCQRNRTCQTAYRQAVKRICLDHYGGARCACCGESRIYFLTLDHVHGDGAADRSTGPHHQQMYTWLRKRGYPDRDRFQVLCYNCNCAKRTSSVCPCSLERFIESTSDERDPRS